MDKLFDGREGRELLDRHVKKKAAISALREIHGMLDAEEREARADRRIAAILTAVLFGSISGLVLVMRVAHRIRTVSSTALGISDLVFVSLFCLLTVLSFAAAYYFITMGRGRAWRIIGGGLLVSLVSSAAILGWLAVLGVRG